MRQEKQVTANKSVILCWIRQALLNVSFLSCILFADPHVLCQWVRTCHSLCFFFCLCCSPSSQFFSVSAHLLGSVQAAIDGSQSGEQVWSSLCTALVIFRVFLKPVLPLRSFPHFFLYVQDFKNIISYSCSTYCPLQSLYLNVSRPTFWNEMKICLSKIQIKMVSLGAFLVV